MHYKWPVMGHDSQIAQLEQDLQQDRVGHAYLFAGPQSIGKHRTARTFAQILQCSNNFCRDCSTCRQVDHGQHIDTLEFLDDGESFKIENIRELITHLSTTPSSRYKIILIQNIERITSDAANALLKNLEEPIHGVIFLLTTTQPNGLLDTILSRTRTIHFHPLPESRIREHLQTARADLDPETLDMMASFSMGKPGRAMTFLSDPDRFRFYQDTYHQIMKFFERSSLTDRMLAMETMAKEPASIEVFLELFSHVVRGFLLRKIEGVSILYSYSELFAMIDHLNQARFDIDHNVNTRMVLERLMFGIQSAKHHSA